MVKNRTVSIIIPTLNAGKYIYDCLLSLAKLDYPKDRVEIIIVDNGSQDRTVGLAKRFNVKILKKPEVTVSSLRNYGAENAMGEILAFIDSDCTASPDWLRNAIDILNGDDIGAVGAEYTLPNNPSWIEKVWNLHIDERRNKGEVEWLPGGNLIVPKKYFIKVGGFKEDLITSEDVDFCRRLRKSGFKIISEDKLSIIHLGNFKTIREFCLKQMWYGRGVLQNFLYALPKIELTKARAFALFMLLCIFGSIAGLINGIINNGWSIFFISISGGILSSFALTTKTLLKKHKWHYFFHLAFLYLVFGVARALCILDHRNWKHLKRCPAIPILLYHDIKPDNFDLSSIEPGLRPYVLKKSDFIEQMEWLAETEHGVTRSPGHQVTSESVIIVFDDGWKSNYEIAYPILKKYGLCATFFVTIKNMGKPEMMTWDELKELANNGMTIGSHNMTHRSPVELSDEEIEYEMKESKKILEEELGRKVDAFSSPTGFYDKRIIGIARKVGYAEVYFSKVALNEIGRSNNPIVFNKIGIKRDCDLEAFKGIVRGDKRILVRLRSKQIVRDMAKSLLGSRKYIQLKSFVLRKHLRLLHPFGARNDGGR